MKISPFLSLNKCFLSNDLWPKFINKIGISKARLAVRQALDLQTMQGTCETLPVLFVETCGAALVSADIIKTYIGLSCDSQGMLLIYSTKLKSIQLLRDN